MPGGAEFGDLALEPLASSHGETIDYDKVLYEALVNEGVHTKVRRALVPCCNRRLVGFYNLKLVALLHTLTTPCPTPPHPTPPHPTPPPTRR